MQSQDKIPQLKLFDPHSIDQYVDESPDSPRFSRHKRHVFIITASGRPVYCRYGDPVNLSSFLATMGAIIEKHQTYFYQDARSQLQKIVQKDKVIYFVNRKFLLYICCCDKSVDAQFQVENMIDFLNLQLISIMTDQVNKRLEQRPNFDPRNQLGGTGSILTLAIKNGLNSPCILLSSYMILPLPYVTRQQIHSILKEQKISSISCTILMSPIHVIDIFKQKFFELKSQDVLLLFNLMQAQNSLRQSENWIPICLPGISPDGFIYCYIQFYTSEIAIVMISDDNSNDSFFACSQNAKHTNERLKQSGALDNLLQAYKESPYPNPFKNSTEIVKNSIKHFIIKQSEGQQITMPNYKVFGKIPKQFKQYQRKYSQVYQRFLMIDKKKEFLFADLDNIEYSGIYVNNEYMVLFIFERFLNSSEINQNLNTIIKWVKQEEQQIFIHKMS